MPRTRAELRCGRAHTKIRNPAYARLCLGYIQSTQNVRAPLPARYLHTTRARAWEYVIPRVAVTVSPCARCVSDQHLLRGRGARMGSRNPACTRAPLPRQHSSHHEAAQPQR